MSARKDHSKAIDPSDPSDLAGGQDG